MNVGGRSSVAGPLIHGELRLPGGDLAEGADQLLGVRGPKMVPKRFGALPPLEEDELGRVFEVLVQLVGQAALLLERGGDAGLGGVEHRLLLALLDLEVDDERKRPLEALDRLEA